MPPHVGAKALSWHWEVLLQPPHWPAMQKSGAQSEFRVQGRPHVPVSAPLHVCAPPQFSVDTQPHVPPLHSPLAQSEATMQVGAPHVPAQRLPAPQSALEAHAFAAQCSLLHVPPVVPQSVATAHDDGGVQVALVQTPVGQSVSPLHVDLLHLAPLQTLVASGQSVSRWQATRLHLAPTHRPLDGHVVSAPHVGAVLHLALLHV